MLAAPRSKDRSNTGKTTKPSPCLALPNTEAVSLTDLDFCRHRDRSKKDSRNAAVLFQTIFGVGYRCYSENEQSVTNFGSL